MWSETEIIDLHEESACCIEDVFCFEIPVDNAICKDRQIDILV